MADLSVTKRFEQLPVPVKLLTAGSAACFADFASFPLDTAKVRLQVMIKFFLSCYKVSAECID